MEQFQVISRNAIPPLRSVEQDGELHDLGELRDFRWNETLRDFMPDSSRFSVSWVRLAAGETLKPHVHPIHSMMVFYRGAGEMLGDSPRPVAKDDVVVVPAGCTHGFVAGEQDLHALSIQFGEGLYTTPEKPRVLFAGEEATLKGLLEHNEMRRLAFLKRPIFDLLRDGTLEDANRRKVYMDTLQIWVDGNQALLYSRQANCADEEFRSVFLKHMQEEVGHDAMHRDRAEGKVEASEEPADAVMAAITNWFTYQMYVLDNAEKAAIIHLVIENASATYHEVARPALARYLNDEYFDVHVEADANHAAMGEALLRNETLKTYARLREIVDEAWDMIGAMTDRVVELTRAAPAQTSQGSRDGNADERKAGRPIEQAGLIENVVILGGGTAGWMTASYLKKAYPNVNFTLIEAPGLPKIGVGEATIPNLQRVFFDFLGIKEDVWMRECNAAFKLAVKFVNWRKPQGTGDHFYHTFGILPNCNNLPLSHYWTHKHLKGYDEPFDYACYKEPALMDAKLAPRFLDGTRSMYYAWHFDAHLVADYLRRLSTEWGVKHILDEVENVELGRDGEVAAIYTKAGRKLEGDLFIDCSGFRGLLINKALKEPFIDMSDYLLCDSAVAAPVPHDDEMNGVEPYTSAIARGAGWIWKIPMLGRFGSGYVYSSKFANQDEASRDFCNQWNLNPDKTDLNKIRFRVGRNRRAWVKNCISIGLASCFVEPLESSGIYFIYAAIYQLAKHFPDKGFNPVLVQRFNEEIETMFDDTRDFIQMHYITTPREDTAFWRANKNDLTVSDQLRWKLDTYKAGLAVNMPVTNEHTYYDNFEAEFRNFWTNGSFYSILSGMGYVPDQAMPSIGYRPESQREAEKLFRDIKHQVADLKARLPSCHELLRSIHQK